MCFVGCRAFRFEHRMRPRSVALHPNKIRLNSTASALAQKTNWMMLDRGFGQADLG